MEGLVHRRAVAKDRVLHALERRPACLCSSVEGEEEMVIVGRWIALAKGGAGDEEDVAAALELGQVLPEAIASDDALDGEVGPALFPLIDDFGDSPPCVARLGAVHDQNARHAKRRGERCDGGVLRACLFLFKREEL